VRYALPEGASFPRDALFSVRAPRLPPVIQNREGRPARKRSFERIPRALCKPVISVNCGGNQAAAPLKLLSQLPDGPIRPTWRLADPGTAFGSITINGIFSKIKGSQHYGPHYISAREGQPSGEICAVASMPIYDGQMRRPSEYFTATRPTRFRSPTLRMIKCNFREPDSGYQPAPPCLRGSPLKA